MNKRRVLLWVVTICLLTALFSITALADDYGWSQAADGSWSYVNEYGTKYSNGVYYIDYERYCFDENGKMCTNKWYQDGEDWYYFGADGKAYNDDVYQIGSAYYGFDGNAVMRADVEFYDFDEKDDRGYNYRAKADGSLYTSTWYELDGERYYFQADGRMCADDVFLINGKYYGFAWDGKMYKDTSFEFWRWDETVGYHVGGYYLAKADGTLYTNEWFYDGEVVFYYGADARRVYNEFYTINGTKYAFDGNGFLIKDCQFSMDVYDDALGCWVYGYYRAKADGKLYVNEWYHDEEIGWYYFGADGKMLKEGVYNINGAYYGFNWDGIMYRDAEFGFGVYDEEQNYIGNVYYRAKADGKLYVNEWYQTEWDEVYYYGAAGVGVKDFTLIDGTWYFFYEESRMARGTWVFSEKYQGNYYISEDGKSYVTAPKTGWVQVGEDDYYFIDNEMCTYDIYQIGGKCYYFNWEGRMFKDCTFNTGRYDEELDEYVFEYYRAKEDGSLYVNEWYETSWGTKYYYGADCAAVKDFVKIDGTWYFFYEHGEMAKDVIVFSEKYQRHYYISRDGKSYTEAPQNGWFLAGEDYYYFVDGQYCSNEFRQINGNYYFFGGDGRMFKDCSFSVSRYDEELGYTVYNDYRAKANGALYVNEWYQDGTSWYYYGAAGVAANDFTQVNGTWYFFQEGWMVKDRLVYSNKYEAYYVISADGKSSRKITGDGWVLIGEDYYYLVDNDMLSGGVFQIGGKYYGFNWEGKMYAGRSFSFEGYDEELGYWVERCYQAKSDGSLYVNEWCDNFGNWYYYGAGGVAVNDFVKIGGTWYFFDTYGKMVTDQLVYSNKYQAYYTISADGKSSREITSDGWIFVGGNYYYMGSGELYQGGVFQIGGKYYGFNYEGVMQKNTTFSFDYYDDDLGYWVYNYYRAKADGTLYVNEWYQDGSTWFYFGAGGAGANDFTQVGGVWYFFEDGRMITDRLMYSDTYEAYYAISADGKSSRKITSDGWILVGDYYYYISYGNLHRYGVYEIGGKYYAFDSHGIMYQGTTFSMDYYDDDLGYWVYSHYRAREDGSLYVNQWYQSDWGAWYYYGAAGAGYNGFATVDGVEYYFDAAEMRKDSCVHYNGAYYALDKDGKRIKTQGKHAVEGYYVYVKADGTLANYEWIGDSYFNYTMQANQLFVLDDKLYAADSAGKCVAVTADGLYNIGYQVYVKGGKVYTGWQKIGSDWYYFDPYMCMNGAFMAGNQRYVFDKNGKMFTGGWLYVVRQYDDPTYVYADASGKAYTGLKTIGGKTYAFSEYGYLCKNTVVTIGGVTYFADENGVATKVDVKNGWYSGGGNYYYLQDGRFVYNRTVEIGGKRYGFDYDGVMCKDGLYQFYYDIYEVVILGTDGVAKTGWLKHNNLPYYADKDGYLVNGKQTIDGKNYYFINFVLQTGTFEWDGMIITTDANGVIVSEKKCADGWSYVDGSVYYYKNGKAFTGWVGDYYISNGYMQWQTVVSSNGKNYALDNYGRYVKSGWITFQGGHYGYEHTYLYAKAGGELCSNEWLQLGSNWYYFNDSCYMVTDRLEEINGQLYKFGADGKYLGKVDTKDGWKQVGSDWYYIHAGEAVRGAHYIDGKYYLFSYDDGALQTNCIVNLYDEFSYYANSKGEKAAYTGWQKINGEWCYFTQDNNIVTGWFQDNGKTYYGAYYYDANDKTNACLFTGYMVSESKLHYFDANGVYQGTRGVENGWFKADGEWYYFRDGKVVNGHTDIGGKTYCFAYSMCTDQITFNESGYVYYGTDGVQRTTKGWYKTSEGWIYVGENGVLYNGVYKIDGKEYRFVDGIMV